MEALPSIFAWFGANVFIFENFVNAYNINASQNVKCLNCTVTSLLKLGRFTEFIHLITPLFSSFIDDSDTSSPATNTSIPNAHLPKGLAVDRENGWICHLSYTHKVAVAWEGRTRVPRPRLMAEYSGKRALKPSERKKRLKPLNDLFSMAECCLMADTVQFFLERGIPFCPRSAVNDVLGSITATHVSGEFHRVVASEPEKYFEPKPYLKGVLDRMKESGKRLIFVR